MPFDIFGKGFAEQYWPVAWASVYFARYRGHSFTIRASVASQVIPPGCNRNCARWTPFAQVASSI